MTRPNYHAIRNAEMEAELGPNHDAHMVDDCHMPERIRIEQKPANDNLFRWSCRCGRVGVWLENDHVAERNSKLHRCGK
jgi:hypothetical protein